MKKVKIYTVLLAGLLALNACSEDLLDVKSEPSVPTSELQELVIEFPEKAFVLLEGIESGNIRYLSDFGSLGNYHDDFGVNAYKLGADFMTDKITMTKSNWFSSYLNYTARIETSIRTRAIWSYFYRVIANMNDGLRLIPNEGNIADDIKFIKARYLAMRADSYFNLVRMYGNNDGVGVPLATVDEVIAARVPSSQIYAQIEQDLLEAYSLIQGYDRPDKDYIDANVVAGMLARYYQQVENWPQAAFYSEKAVEGYAPMDAANLFDGFNKIGNSEWIWGFDVDTQTSSYYASFFSQMGNLNPGYAGLLESYKSVDKRIFDQIPGSDLRKQWFADDGNAFGLPKYANVKFIDDTDFEGDYVYMRAGEMFLINAEANAHINPSLGKTVLEDFVKTRNPSFTAPSDQATLLNEIYFQRSVELWGEGGWAYFDMKRLGKGMNRAYSGSNHTINQLSYPANSEKFNFQLPLIEMDNNPEAVQNPN